MRMSIYFFNLVSSDYTAPTWAVIIAGAFVILTLGLSFYLVFEHLIAYKNPEEQKFLIGVILMVPCYSIESFVSLIHPAISVDIEILRDCYEYFAMYCFGRYLVACLGQKFGSCTCTRVMNSEKAEIDDIVLIRDEDHLFFQKNSKVLECLIQL